jgi:hypothetical protein
LRQNQIAVDYEIEPSLPLCACCASRGCSAKCTGRTAGRGSAEKLGGSILLATQPRREGHAERQAAARVLVKSSIQQCPYVYRDHSLPSHRYSRRGGQLQRDRSFFGTIHRGHRNCHLPRTIRDRSQHRYNPSALRHDSFHCAGVFSEFDGGPCREPSLPVPSSGGILMVKWTRRPFIGAYWRSLLRPERKPDWLQKISIPSSAKCRAQFHIQMAFNIFARLRRNTLRPAKPPWLHCGG